MINFYSEYTVFAQDLTQHLGIINIFITVSYKFLQNVFLRLISTKVSREHNKGEKRLFVHKATWPFAWMHTEHFNKSTPKSMIEWLYSTMKWTDLSDHTVNSTGIYTRQYPIISVEFF